MFIYEARYVYEIGYSEGDMCTSGGSYNKWRTDVITASSKSAVMRAIQVRCPEAKRLRVRKLGEA